VEVAKYTALLLCTLTAAGGIMLVIVSVSEDVKDAKKIIKESERWNAIWTTLD